MEKKIVLKVKGQLEHARIMRAKSRRKNFSLITDSILEKYNAQLEEEYWADNITAYEEALNFELDSEESEREFINMFEQLVS